MVAHLNLKGRVLINGVDEILNHYTLHDYQNFSPFIDTKREKYFSHDAFEICFIISKA